MKRKIMLRDNLMEKMLGAHQIIQDYSLQQGPPFVGYFEKDITKEELIEAKDLFNVTKKKLLDLLI